MFGMVLNMAFSSNSASFSSMQRYGYLEIDLLLALSSKIHLYKTFPAQVSPFSGQSFELQT